MGRVKRHHHTAQAYLKRFADGNGRLMVYDRITQETRLQHVSKVAVESDLYAISDADGQPNDFFERGLFQSVDGAIAPILSKLLEDRPLLTHSERDNVNAYLVLQHGRTPFMRDTLEDIHDLMLRRHVETSVGGGSPEEVERFIEEFEPHASEDEKDTIDRSPPTRANWSR
jgi:hypothetical protein